MSTDPPAVPDHTLLRIIGEGSYGEVWLARNAVGTLRAVKIIRRHRFDSGRPFEREFYGLQKYEPVSRAHEGLMDVLHLGRNDPEGYFYYVMELAERQVVAGSGATDVDYAPRTLSSEIRKFGRIPPDECLKYFVSLAGGMDHLHRCGLLHRDVKPSNIIFVGGVAKLADIGLVAEMSESQSFVGTEGFIPPEGPGTAAADIYSLGKVLYEAFSGMDRMEFPQLPKMERGHLQELAPLMELSAITTRACAPQRSDRYATAAQMQGDLALILSGRSLKSVRALESNLRTARRSVVAMGAAGLLLAGGFGIKALWESQRSAIEREAREKVEAAHYGQSLALAQAECLSGEMGHRFRALRALTEAAERQPGSIAVRNQAITALALPDMETVRWWPEIKDATGERIYCSFSENLTSLARVLEDGAVHITSVREENGPEVIYKPDAPVRVLGPFSPDGKFLLAGGSKGWRVIGTGDGMEVLRLAVPQTPVKDRVEWTRDSSGLIVLQQTGLLMLSLKDGDHPQLLPVPGVNGLMSTVSNTGMLAVGSLSNGKLSLVDTLAGRIATTLDQGVAASFVALDPTGTWLAAGAQMDYKIRAYPLKNPDLPPLVFTGHGGFVPGASFSPDGDLLLSTSWDGTMRLFRMSDGWMAAASRRSYLGRVQFSTDGRSAGFFDVGALRPVIAKVEYGEVCRQITEPLPAQTETAPWQSVFLTPDLVATATGDGVRLYDAASGRTQEPLIRSQRRLIALAAKSNVLFTGGPTGFYSTPLLPQKDGRIVAGETKQLSRELSLDFAVNEDADVVAVLTGPRVTLTRGGNKILEAGSDGISRSIALSPDNKWLAIGGKSTRVLSAETGKPAWKNDSGSVSSNAFDPGGKIFILPELGKLAGRDAATGNVIWELPVEGISGGMAACSPDGKLTACRLTPMNFDLLETATGRLIARLEHPVAKNVQHFAFSPDGSKLSVTAGGHAVQIWDLRKLRKNLREMGLDWKDSP